MTSTHEGGGLALTTRGRGRQGGGRGTGRAAARGKGRGGGPRKGRGAGLRVRARARGTDTGEEPGGLGRGGGLGRPADAHAGPGPLLARPAYGRSGRPSCPRETYLSRVPSLSSASTLPARRGGRCPPGAGAAALGPRRRDARSTSAGRPRPGPAPHADAVCARPGPWGKARPSAPRKRTPRRARGHSADAAPAPGCGSTSRRLGDRKRLLLERTPGRGLVFFSRVTSRPRLAAPWQPFALAST